MLLDAGAPLGAAPGILVPLPAVVGSLGGRLAVVVAAGMSVGAEVSAVTEGMGSGCFGGSLLSQAAITTDATAMLPRTVKIGFNKSCSLSL